MGPASRRRIGWGQTLAAFDPHDNGITAARLLLAMAVLVSHATVITGFGEEPLLGYSRGTVSLGSAAVIGFFALSGFLIAGSRERTRLLPYLRNRALRILPGYWFALVLTALVAAPIAASLTGSRFDAGVLPGWIAPRLLFIPQARDNLEPLFAGMTVNGSLWTLPVEFLCYLLVAIVPARYLRPVMSAELGALLAMGAVTSSMQNRDVILLAAFATGSCLYLWRRWIPMSAIAVAAVSVVTVISFSQGAMLVTVPGLAYLGLALAWIPFRIERDLSYGVYVLAYPTQVLLTLAGIGALGLAVTVAVSAAVVLGLALVSWTLVERPALSLRSRSRGAAPVALVQRRPSEA